MKKFSKKNIITLTVIFFALLITAYISFSRNMVTSSVESVFYAQRKGDSFKTDLKIFIKEKIFVFRNQKLLKRELLNNPIFARSMTQENIAPKSNLQTQWAAGYLKNKQQKFYFQKIKTAEKTVNNKKYQLDYFQGNIFTNEIDEYGFRMYLHYDNQQLFFITGEGILGTINLNKNTLASDTLQAQTIASNIENFIDANYDDYDNNIRDLFIDNGKIYVSQNIAFNNECFGTILFSGFLNKNKINFEQLLAPKGCNQNNFSNEQQEEITFTPDYTLSGGRILKYNTKQLLLSTGDMIRQAQANEKIAGKILAVNIANGTYEVISKGHRNPQGLFYDKKNNIIFSTEHGPLGGDEINLNNSLGGKVENFGWPIASYGFEYHYDPETDENIFKTSHQNHGFVEPLHYYTPSIGISEIIQINEKFNAIKQKQILIAALTGSNPDPQSGGNGISHLILNDDYSIKQKDVFDLDGRIRDIIYAEELNSVITYLEDAKSIIIIKALPQ